MRLYREWLEAYGRQALDELRRMFPNDGHWGFGLPSLKNWSDFFAGWSDALTGGATQEIREGAGYDDAVDHNSGFGGGAINSIGLGGGGLLSGNKRLPGAPGKGGGGRIILDGRPGTPTGRPGNNMRISPSPKDILDKLPGRRGKTGPIKEVPDEKAIDDLWKELDKHGKPAANPGTYPGPVHELPDGTIIRKRPGSKSGGTTLDITLPDGTKIKVHVR